MLKGKRNFLKATLSAMALGMVAGAGPALAQDDPLVVGWASVGAFEPLFIAERNGWFEEAGLNIQLVEATTPQENIARLMSGEFDVVGGSGAPSISAISNGVPIKIVSGNQSIHEEPTVGLVVRADSEYQTIEDLAGAKIGTFGLQGTGSMMIYRAMREAGLDFDAAELVNVPPPTFIENLENGNVDAIVPFALFYQLALNNENFRLIPEPYETMIGVPGIVYVSSNKVLGERGDEVAKFIEVFDRASQYANEHPDEVRAIDKELTRLPPNYLDNRPLSPADVKIDVGALESLAADMAEFGFIGAPLTADELLWDRAPR